MFRSEKIGLHLMQKFWRLFVFISDLNQSVHQFCTNLMKCHVIGGIIIHGRIAGNLVEIFWSIFVVVVGSWTSEWTSCWLQLMPIFNPVWFVLPLQLQQGMKNGFFPFFYISFIYVWSPWRILMEWCLGANHKN